MAIKPNVFRDMKMGWCVQIVAEGLPRTFSGLSSERAAGDVGRLQLSQVAKGAPLYTAHELKQMGFCGEVGSYEVALNKRRSKFGVVQEDGSIKRLMTLT